MPIMKPICKMAICCQDDVIVSRMPINRCRQQLQGNEGLTYGLLTTVSNLGSPFSRAISNQAGPGSSAWVLGVCFHPVGGMVGEAKPAKQNQPQRPPFSAQRGRDGRLGRVFCGAHASPQTENFTGVATDGLWSNKRYATENADYEFEGEGTAQ